MLQRIVAGVSTRIATCATRRCAASSTADLSSPAPLIITIVLLAASVAPAYSAPPPNILLIKIEDTNDWVEGFGGHPDTRTPSLVELASRGVRFENAQAPAPLCNPSKTATLTGLAPRRTGVLTNQQTPMRNWIPPHAKTLFEFFLDRGYYVAGNGLIFHQDPDTEAEPWSELPPYNWYRGQAPATPFHGLPELSALTPGFDWGPTAGAASQWGDYKIATYGTQFLGRSHSAPFLLALGFTMPHLQWWMPQAYWDSAPANPALPPYLPDDRSDTPPYTRNKIDSQQHRIIMEGGKWQEAIRAYLASINFVDSQIGRVLGALNNSAYASNTIVVFYSDHGYHLGEKDVWGKGTLWEESARVPFIIVAPGVAPAGAVSNKPVSLMDIYPTLVELAGFTSPQQLDGVSLADVVRDPVNGQRANDFAVMSYYFGDTIRNERWRYIHYTPADPAEGGEELYDHDNDPDEHTNLAALPAYASIKAGLAAQLAQALTFGPSLLPSLTISAPQEGDQVSGSGVVLSATSLDPEDGDLSGAIQWTSDIDGPLTSPANLTIGPHVLTASVTDADGQTVTRHVNVRVREARDDQVQTDVGVSPVVIDALANDLGFGDPVVAQLVSGPTAGTVSVVGSPGSQAGIRFEYTPPVDFTGVETFTYSIDDGTNLDTASVEVLVRPSVVPSLAITAPHDGDQFRGSDVVLSATAGDLEDGDLSGSVQWTSDIDGPISSPANLSIGLHVITAAVTDSDGHGVTRQVSVRVREARNDFVVAANASSAVVINVLDNDVGFGDPVVVESVTGPAAGSVTVVGSPGNKSGIHLEYSPPPGFSGVAAFTYQVDDGINQDTASVEVTIPPDSDGDGVIDSEDNCLAVPNPGQLDTSADGFGNLCDADLDNSGGIVNFGDLVLFRAAFGSSNANADLDGNGAVNFADLATFRSLFGKAPGPSGLHP